MFPRDYLGFDPAVKRFFTDRREAAAAIRDGSEEEAEAHIDSWTETIVVYSRRAAAGRSELRALTQAALLAEFQESSKLPPCGTARQRRRGVFDGAASWAWGFWTLRKSEKNSSKFSKN